MAQFIPDDLDWQAYAVDAEAKVKVRQASAFADELAAEFTHRERHQQSVMFSTKLRDAIEFRPAEVTAWAGYNGHRKSMFTGQVALDLCVQNERTLVISLEMTPQKTLARMARQAMGAEWLTADQRNRFMQWSDDRLWLFDHVGRLQADQCLAVCRYFSQKLKGRHVFIDSLMKVCQSEESMDEQKQLVSDLCDTAKETGLHIHLVAHCRKPAAGEDNPPGKYDLRGTAAISDQCHNVITVWQNKGKRAEKDKPAPDPKKMDQPDAAVTIEKQRNGEVEARFGLWFHDPSLRFCDDRITRVEPYHLGAE